MKYTRFQDIPQFTRSGNYQVNVHWKSIEQTLESFALPGFPVELDPDFQRGHVWTEAKQIHYVEFILRGGRSSKVIYFNQPGWNRLGRQGAMQLVDGKQRLEAVRKFLRNEFPIFGSSYMRDFTDTLRPTTADFIFTVNDLQTRAEVLQWYLDLNTGGVVHTDEEIEKVKRLLKKEVSLKCHLDRATL